MAKVLIADFEEVAPPAGMPTPASSPASRRIPIAEFEETPAPQPQPPQPTPGLASQYGWGLADLAADAADVGDYVSPGALRTTAFDAVQSMMGKAQEPQAAAQADAQFEQAQTDRRQGIHETLDPLMGASAPVEGSEEAARADAAKGLAMTAPFLPFTGPIVGSLAAAGAVTAPFLARAADEEYGPAAGLAAELAATLIVPGGAELGAPRVLKSINKMRASEFAKTNATPQIHRLLEEVNKRIQARYPDAKVGLEQLFENSAELKRLFPRSRVEGGEEIDFIQEAIEQLDAAAGDFPKYQRARPAQAMNNRITRHSLSGFEEGLTDVRGIGDDMIRLAEGQEEQFSRNITQKFQEALPEGTPDDAVAFWESTVDDAQQLARDSWKGVDLADMPDLPAGDLLGKIEDIYTRAEGAEKLVPTVLKRLRREAPDNLTMTRLQNTRSQLLEIERNSSSLTDVHAGTKAKWAKEARKELDTLIDTLPEAEGEAYSAARSATRAWKRMTDPGGPGADIVKNMTKPSGSVESLGKTLLKNEETAKRAMEIFGKSPQAREAIRRTAMNEVFGSETLDQLGKGGVSEWIAGSKTPRQIRSAIRSKRRALDEVLGPDKVDQMEVIATWIDQAKSGRLAKKGAILSAGSNRARAVVEAAGDLQQPINIAGKAIKALLAKIESDPTRIALMQEVFLDPELMSGLLKMPTDAAVPAYVLKWKQAIARATARTAAVSAVE
jgi:hypothetical protein